MIIFNVSYFQNKGKQTEKFNQYFVQKKIGVKFVRVTQIKPFKISKILFDKIE